MALLVDDEELVRLSTADMLTELGYTVVEADSGERALELVQRGLEPNLLVTDHLMSGISGTELAHSIRYSRSDTKVLVVSGYAEAEGIDPGLPRLTKPFRSADLAGSLVLSKQRHYLDSARSSSPLPCPSAGKRQRSQNIAERIRSTDSSSGMPQRP